MYHEMEFKNDHVATVGIHTYRGSGRWQSWGDNTICFDKTAINCPINY